MTKMSLIAMIGVIAGLVGSCVIPIPALAVTTPALELSDVSDLTPGQSLSATVTDVSGVLCDQSYGVGEWNVYLSWYRDGLITPVGYSVAQSSQSSPFIAGSSVVISANFYVVWLEHDSGNADYSTWDGTYTAVAGCMTAGNGGGDIANGDGMNHTGTASTPVSTTYVPVTVSRTQIPQGESFDVTVTDASSRWCDFATGSEFSMGARFDAQDQGSLDFTVPGNLSFGGVPGVGDFTWANSDATVTVTIPSDTTPGDYLLALTCVQAGPSYTQGSRDAVFGIVTVTAVGPNPTPPSPLPNTGLRVPNLFEILGLALLFGTGVCFVAVARRSRRASFEFGEKPSDSQIKSEK